MRRSTQIAPFSRIALLAALGVLGLTAFAPSAHAADTVKAAANKPASAVPAPAVKPAGTKTPDKKTRDTAHKAYSEGEKAFAAHDFAAAYTGFAKANEVIPSAHAAYWAAKSLDQGGKTNDAINAYTALLADPGSSKIGEDKVTDAETRLATLKATLVGEVTVSTLPSIARLSVDGLPQTGTQPVVLKLAPGPHKLTFSAEGFEMKEVDIQVQAGTKVEQRIEMAHIAAPAPAPAPAPEPVVTAPPSPAPSAEKHSKVPAYVTLGIATGGAIVGTIFGVQALQSKSDYDSKPTSKSADDTERNALIADMAFGVAITLGVTGIVLLTSSDDAADAPKAATLHLPPKNTFRVVPYIGRESGGAAARLTF
ncbi:MAG: PEGA domain-containing protein [Polyangiaceae bacterium]